MIMDLFSTLQLLHEAAMSVLVTTILYTVGGVVLQHPSSKLNCKMLKFIKDYFYNTLGFTYN